MENEKYKLILFWGTVIVTILYVISFFSLTFLSKVIGLLLVLGLFKLSNKYLTDEDIDKYCGKGYLNKIMKKIRNLCRKDLNS